MKKHSVITLIVLTIAFSARSQWPSDGINNTVISNNVGMKYSTVVTPGLDGKVFIAWFESNPNLTLKMQLINADGTLAWREQGIIISTSENQNPISLQITGDGEGNAYIVWYDSYNGTNALNAAKISSLGNILWGNGGIKVYQTESYEIYNPTICLSQAGNLFISSEIISIMGETKGKIILQKIGNDGASSWENPLMIEDSSLSCANPRLVSSGTDGCMISFIKSHHIMLGDTLNLWVQKIDENGKNLFGEGKILFNNHRSLSFHESYDAISGGNDDMLIAWTSYTDNGGKWAETYIQHISSKGVFNFQANGVLVSTELLPAARHYHPVIAGKNQRDETVVFWDHVKFDTVLGILHSPEIYAQKFSSTGERLWTDFGKRITYNKDSVTTFNIDDAFMCNNKSFLIYDRTDINDLSYLLNKVFAIGIDNFGDFLWQDSTSTISSSNTNKSYIVCTSFADNQSLVGWVETDSISNSTIMGQYFTIDGMVTNYESKLQPSEVIFLPNPVNDVLSFLSKSSLILINVYDIIGNRLVIERNNTITRINLSNLNPGIYIVEYITSSGYHGSKKIIKN